MQRARRKLLECEKFEKLIKLMQIEQVIIMQDLETFIVS